MLILTRKVGESLFIGDEIEITITEISKNTARIGIDAPKDLPVYRKEIYEKIKSENLKAAKTQLGKEDLDRLNNLLFLTQEKKDEGDQ